MAENPISHVVSVLKGAIEQIERRTCNLPQPSPNSVQNLQHFFYYETVNY